MIEDINTFMETNSAQLPAVSSFVAFDDQGVKEDSYIFIYPGTPEPLPNGYNSFTPVNQKVYIDLLLKEKRNENQASILDTDGFKILSFISRNSTFGGAVNSSKIIDIDTGTDTRNNSTYHYYSIEIEANYMIGGADV